MCFCRRVLLHLQQGPICPPAFVGSRQGEILDTRACTSTQTRPQSVSTTRMQRGVDYQYCSPPLCLVHKQANRPGGWARSEHESGHAGSESSVATTHRIDVLVSSLSITTAVFPRNCAMSSSHSASLSANAACAAPLSSCGVCTHHSVLQPSAHAASQSPLAHSTHHHAHHVPGPALQRHAVIPSLSPPATLAQEERQRTILFFAPRGRCIAVSPHLAAAAWATTARTATARTAREARAAARARLRRAAPLPGASRGAAALAASSASAPARPRRRCRAGVAGLPRPHRG